ncbi:MAG: transcriptional regulator [Pseudonocardiales bacterium]|nr:MAG: transcriptional regulator [Pseudonocardiales bacterium]
MAPPTPTEEQPTYTAPELGEPSQTLLTVEDAARRLSVGRTTMYALLKAGHVNSVRIGRLRRIPAEALAAYTARLIAERHAA